MKYLPRFSLLFTSLLFLFVSYGQTYTVKGGFNLATEFPHSTGTYIEDEFNPGFQLGGRVGFSLNSIFSIETGLSFISKGIKWREYLVAFDWNGSGTGDMSYTKINSINLYYLDVPLLIKASIPLKNVQLIGSFGTYLGQALWGRHKTEYLYTDRSTHDSESLMDWSNRLRTNFGLKSEFGIVFSSIQLNLFYDIGYSYTGGIRVFGISAGYILGRDKE